MTVVHIVIGSAAILFNGLAGAWGAWCWLRRRASPSFWVLLRAGQGLVILEAILGGIWIATGTKASELHLIYGLVPIFLGFMAEQLRISAAQMILDKRGFESTADVGDLPEVEQRSIVVSVLRREIGVMTLSSLVTLVLIIRAAMVH